ncbi:Mitogen-activated protein kinase 4 [Ancistrocladus abbreviatus]
MAFLHDHQNNRHKHQFTLGQTLFEVNKKYTSIKAIGRGSYGVVCSAFNRKTSQKVAIKKIFNVFDNLVGVVRALRELKILRHVKHKNMIELKDVVIPDHHGFNDVYFVYELVNTDLDRVIQSPQPLSNDHCRFFIFQLLQGLNCLHSANILHQDVKPRNLLVNANCDIKICDFGLARTRNGDEQYMTDYVVSRWYRAPELLLCSNTHGSPIDVWSVGCIFAKILGRKPIFCGRDSLHQLGLIFTILGSPYDADLEFVDKERARNYIRSLPYSEGIPFSILYPNVDLLAIDSLQRLLVFDPLKRITASEALQHPYLSDLYDPILSLPIQFLLDLYIDENSGEQNMRNLMLREILRDHPEVAITRGAYSGW